MPRPQTVQITQFILSSVGSHPADIAAITAERFGISRQAAHRYLARLVRSGELQAEGNTKSRRYRLAIQEQQRWYDVRKDLEEHVVWDESPCPFCEACLRAS